MTPTRGVVAGLVVEVRSHPNADKIRIAIVDINAEKPLQIVFGGPPIVTPGSLVPVAPPGSRVGPQLKKMRRRTYRGTYSQGMLCSLAELGWVETGPDEVALLTDVVPGQLIDDFADGGWLTHTRPSRSATPGEVPHHEAADHGAPEQGTAESGGHITAPLMVPFEPSAVFSPGDSAWSPGEPRNPRRRVPTHVGGGGIGCAGDF